MFPMDDNFDRLLAMVYADMLKVHKEAYSFFQQKGRLYSHSPLLNYSAFLAENSS